MTDATENTMIEETKLTADTPVQQQEQIVPGADTFIIGSGELLDIATIKDLVEKPKQFIVITGKNQFASVELYHEEVKVLKGLFARLEQFKLNDK